MFVPFSWLKEFVDVKTTAEKVAENLLLTGTKVEAINRKNNEVIFNFEITPNRPDTLSILGIARELAAIESKDVTLPPSEPPIFGKLPTKKIFLEVKAKKLCPYYSIVALDGIKVKESPNWIKNYLSLCEIRPINNIVDITNLVMLEFGQPMHAFDKNKINGELTLRASKKNENVTTLDGVERKLPEGSIIIQDEEKLIDLAGLMGGKNSEIDKKTNSIVLLVPVFDPVSIRKTSLTVNLRTEASNRFEKKLDPNMHPLAINRAVNLLVEEAGAIVGSQITSVGYPVKESTLEFEETKVSSVLGIELGTKDIINLLTPLGFQVKRSSFKDDVLQIQIPSYRQDVSIEEDILEEIGRIYGYNRFPKTLPSGKIPVQKETFEPDVERVAREFLLESLFTETLGYTLVSEEDLLKIGFEPKNTLKVLHPTSRDFVYLRPNLLINGLKAAVTNEKVTNLSFFEIGKEFKKEINNETKLPEQRTALFLISSESYERLKGVVEAVLLKFALKVHESTLENEKDLKQGVNYFEGKNLIAKVGTVNEDLLKAWSIKRPLVSAWINFETLKQKPIKTNYQPKQKYPSVVEDISIFVSNEATANKIIEGILSSNKLVKKVDVIDVFKKDSRRSLTFRINFADPNRTLASTEVAKVREKISKMLEKNFKGEIRKD